jgi:hypothetical protein
MSQTTTYNVHCHCKKHNLIITTTSLSSQPVFSCNCSYCSGHGSLIIFVHPENISGSIDDMGSYEFGRKTRKWRYCTGCGSMVVGEMEGDRGWGINVGFLSLL